MSEQTMMPTDAEVKAKHRAMWALGDYGEVAARVIPGLGPVLVAAARIGEGDSVLDVAAGSGNAAIPAALTGAEVVASDLTPQLLEEGRQEADVRGARLTWKEADAEALPFAEGEFDVVISCVGAMFAPHHEATAAELLRVCRPGGRIALIAWTPGGFIGEMFRVMKPFAPAPPPGAQPPPLWGDAGHVRALLGDGVSEFEATTHELEVEVFDTGAAFRDFFKATYGPTIATYRAIAEDPAKVAALDEGLAALGDRALTEGRMAWEYLLVTARRAPA